MGDLPAGVTHWDGPGLEAWRGAWRPEEIARQLEGVGVPWCVVGGWAIDLFLGHETRAHEDLEIAILRPDFERVRAHLSTFAFYSVGDGEVRALPRDASPPEDKHQNWVLDVEAQQWRVDVMMEPGDAHTWVYRRDPAITAPRAAMIGARNGIPYLKPEGALLFKAKAPRPKDEADFAHTLPAMDADARAWLRMAIVRAYPGHAWIAAL